MNVISPSYSFLSEVDGTTLLIRLERIARVCYQSKAKMTENSYRDLLQGLLKRGHESVLEHESVTVKIICDRGVSHELVRHRLASYTQQSTRYCREVTFIKPCFWEEGSPQYKMWYAAMRAAERAYLDLLDGGAAPQEARSVLPNSLKTEIVVTMNLREWRHFFRLRTAKDAHPQMREIACPLLKGFREKIPLLFDTL